MIREKYDKGKHEAEEAMRKLRHETEEHMRKWNMAQKKIGGKIRKRKYNLRSRKNKPRMV